VSLFVFVFTINLFSSASASRQSTQIKPDPPESITTKINININIITNLNNPFFFLGYLYFTKTSKMAPLIWYATYLNYHSIPFSYLPTLGSLRY